MEPIMSHNFSTENPWQCCVNQTATNSTLSDAQIFVSEIMSIPLVVLSMTVLVTGIFGNILIIYLYGFIKRNRLGKFHKMLLILGIVDLIGSISNPIYLLYHDLKLYTGWFLRDFECKIFPEIGENSSNISLAITMIMAIDRDRAICTPLKKQISTKSIYKGIGVTIILSISLSVPSIYLFESVKNQYCSIKESYAFYVFTFAKLVLKNITFVLILGPTTIRIFVKLRKKDNTTGDLRSNELRSMHTKRTLKMVAAIGICFVLFVFPKEISFTWMYYQSYYGASTDIKFPLFFLRLFRLMYYFNSSINVFLYSLLSSRFRQEILLILKTKKNREIANGKVMKTKN